MHTNKINDDWFWFSLQSQSDVKENQSKNCSDYDRGDDVRMTVIMMAVQTGDHNNNGMET